MNDDITFTVEIADAETLTSTAGTARMTFAGRTYVLVSAEMVGALMELTWRRV